LSFSSQEIVLYKYCQEMQSSQWWEWSGQWISSMQVEAPQPSLTDCAQCLESMLLKWRLSVYMKDLLLLITILF